MSIRMDRYNVCRFLFPIQIVPLNKLMRRILKLLKPWEIIDPEMDVSHVEDDGANVTRAGLGAKNAKSVRSRASIPFRFGGRMEITPLMDDAKASARTRT